MADEKTTPQADGQIEDVPPGALTDEEAERVAGGVTSEPPEPGKGFQAPPDPIRDAGLSAIVRSR